MPDVIKGQRKVGSVAAFGFIQCEDPDQVMIGQKACLKHFTDSIPAILGISSDELWELEAYLLLTTIKGGIGYQSLGLSVPLAQQEMRDFYSASLDQWYTVLIHRSVENDMLLFFVPSAGIPLERKNIAVYHKTLAMSPFPVQLIDQQGFFLWGNVAFSRLFGKNNRDGVSFFSDKQLLTLGFESFFERAKNGHTVEFPEFTYWLHNGEEAVGESLLRLRMIVVPVFDKRFLTRKFVVVYQTIPNRYSAIAEKKYDGQISPIAMRPKPDALIKTNHDGQVITMNTVAERLTGWSEQEAVGCPVGEILRLVSVTTRQPVTDPVTEIIAGELAAGQTTRLILVSRDGKEYQVFCIAAPVVGPEQEVKGVVLVLRDVTDEYLAVKALLESNERYKAVFAWAPVGIFHFDTDGVIYDVNQEFVRMIGSSREALIGLEMLRRIEDQNILFGVRESLSGRMFHYDGIYHSVTARKSTPVRGDFVGIRNDVGEIIGGIGLFEDVSEKKVIEKELQLKNSVYESSLSGNSISTTEGILFSVNNAFVKLWGMKSKEDAFGKPISFFFDDPDVAYKVIEEIRQSGKWRGEFIARRPDGSCFHAQAIASALYDDQQAVCYQSSVIDITETKMAMEALEESEAKFRSIADNASDMIALLSPEGIYQYCNNAYLKVLGYEPSELKGRSCFEIVHPAERTEILEFYTTLGYEHCDRAPYLVFRLVSKDDQVRWVEHRLGKTIDTKEGKVVVLTATDITERFLSERSLGQTQESFADIYHSVSDSICIMDEGGEIIDVNRSAEIMYGRSREQLVGQSYSMVAAEGLNDINKVGHIFSRVFQNGIPEKFEFWAFRSNGEVFPEEAIVNKGKYFGKNVLIITARDITLKKKTERQLVESHTRSRALLEAVPDLMFVFDRNCTITDYHSGREDDLLIPAGMFLNKRVDDVLPPHLVELTHRMVSLVLETGKPAIADYTLEIGGRLRYFETRYVPSGTDEVMSMVRDITAQHDDRQRLIESESRYRALVESAFEGIFILSLEGEILFANPSVVKIFEGSESSQLVGRKVFDFVHPDSLEKVHSALRSVAERAVSGTISEYLCTTLNNRLIWVETTSKRIDYQGERVDIVSIRDITAEKNAKQAIQRRDKLLQSVAGAAQLLMSASVVDEAIEQVICLVGEAAGLGQAVYFTVHNAQGTACLLPLVEWTREHKSDDPLAAIVVGEINLLLEKLLTELTEGRACEVPVNIMERADSRLAGKYGFSSILLVPVRPGGTLNGLLGFYKPVDCNEWSPGEKEAFNIAGSLLGSFLQRMNNEAALKESEEKYRLLAENAEDVIWMMDMKGKYHFMSPSVEKLLGYLPSEIIAGKFDGWLTPQSSALVNELLGEAIRNIMAGVVQDVKVFRVEQVRRDGSTVWTEVKVAAIYDHHKNFKYFLGVSRDVTLQQKKEQALARSEQEKEALLKALPDQLFVIDAEGVISGMYAGNDPVATTGRHEWVGSNLYDIYPYQVARMFYASLPKVTRSKEVVQFSFSLQHDETARHYEARLVPVADRFLVIVRDMTNEREAVDSLRQSEEKYRLLQGLFRKVSDNMPDMLWAKDKEKKYVFVNRSLCDKLLKAVDTDEPIGKDDIFFSARERALHPDDPDWHTFGTVCNGSDDYVLSTGATRRFEEYGYINGKQVCLDVVKTPLFNEKGEVVGVVGAGRDITVRVRHEKIRQVQYRIAKAVIETNGLREFMEVVQEQVNQLVDAANFYLALYDETTGMCHSPFSSDEKDSIEVWPAHRSATGLVIESGAPLLMRYDDFLDLTKSGRLDLIGERAACWLGVPLKNGNNIIGAFVVQNYVNPDAYHTDDMETLVYLAQNISLAVHKFRNEELLHIALQKAKESEKLKSAFLANISHEIRTPLNGILGFAGLLTEENLDMNQVRYFASIIALNGNRLLGLINDIIDISRIEAGITSIEISDVSPVDVVNDIVSQFSIRTQGRDIVVRKVVDDDSCYDLIETDSLRLHQILYNLADNAVKFTKEGHVEVGYFRLTDTVCFYVKDSGIGIPADKIPLIFDHFYQVDSSYSRGYEGAGLGLSLCRSLTELLGGTISVVSGLNKGSMFKIELPVSAGNPVSNTEHGLPGQSPLNDKVILVADDDPVRFAYLSALLTGTKVKILSAGSAAGIFSLLSEKNQPVDLLLVNVMLFESAVFIKDIRRCFASLPVVALFDSSFRGESEVTWRDQYDGILPEPFTKRILIKALSEIFLR